MGMYTGVRCKVIIKPDFRGELLRISENDYEWSKSRIKFIKDYGYYARATFIPMGALCYMPDEWEQAPYDEYGSGVPSDGFDRNFNYETGLWTFQCSLKDYNETIEFFFRNVLSKIVEEIIHLETIYEESSHSTLYELKDNEIIRKEGKGINYGGEADDDLYY